ncbi:MAG TPA: hypothetical protein VFV39_05455 [Limnobacter sp.]|nr:hypothetical protein [Limnobacter sp.]
MRFIYLRPIALGISVAALLGACNSDTFITGEPGSNVNPSERPEGNFVGRYAFDAEEFGDLEAYKAELGFEITDTNGPRFISDALKRVVDIDLPELENLSAVRLTNANSPFVEQNGLEPLFDSGFKLRTRNCKLGGTSSIEVFDDPLNFRPDPADATQTRFSDCADPQAVANQSTLIQGDQITFIKKYDGLMASTDPAEAEANFSDLFSLKRTSKNGEDVLASIEESGRQDFSVKRTSTNKTSFIATEDLKEKFFDAEGELIAEIGEVAQRELKATGDERVLRFQALRFAPDQAADLISSKYSSEEGRSVNATTPVKAGFYNTAGDPYHPNTGSTPPIPKVGLVDGGMAAFGKNGKIELVFKQDPVEGFTNIVRVIKTIGSTVTHDCKVPYFSVYRQDPTSAPRFTFAAEGKCLVDGEPFPPEVEPPPPPPPPPPACFVRDLVNTIRDNDPTPLSSALGVVLNPATDVLCMVVGAIPVPIPTP